MARIVTLDRRAETRYLDCMRALYLVTLALACTLPPDPSEVTFRGDIYENGGPLTDQQVKDLLDGCPAKERVWQVRQLSAPQPAGVDFRLELTLFMDHPQAGCLEDSLVKQGLDELETDTVFGDYDYPDGTWGGGSTSTTG